MNCESWEIGYVREIWRGTEFVNFNIFNCFSLDERIRVDP